MKSILFRYSFAILLALSYKLFYIVLSPLTIFTTFSLLSIFTPVTLNENMLTLQSASFIIIPACIAASAYLFLAILILLTRNISFRKGLELFLMGSGLIFLFNVIRILLLIFVYVKLGENYFQAIHLTFWYVLSTIVVVLIWIFLTKKYKIKEVPVYSDLKSLVSMYK
jgi:exosortase/archaeosortase family protein